MIETIEQAEDLIKAGRAEEAVAWLDQVTAAQPGFMRAHSACAAAHIQLNNPEQAIGHLEALLTQIDKMPNPVRARVGIAQRFMRAGGLKQADRLLNEAIQLEPDNVEALVKRGDVQGHLGGWANALELYDRALEHLPDHPEILSSAGVAAQQAGDLAKAIDYYEGSLEDASDQRLIFHNLVAALVQTGEMERAQHYCDQWLEQRPSDIEAMAFHALLLNETRTA